MSDVPCLRYVLPKFKPGYNRAMKTLISSLKYESSDPAQFHFHVLEHGSKYGVDSAVSAFGKDCPDPNLKYETVRLRNASFPC